MWKRSCERTLSIADGLGIREMDTVIAVHIPADGLAEGRSKCQLACEVLVACLHRPAKACQSLHLLVCAQTRYCHHSSHSFKERSCAQMLNIRVDSIQDEL